MKLARQLALIALAACSSAPKSESEVASPTTPPTPSAPDKPVVSTASSAAAQAVAAASTVDLNRERTLVDESNAAREASDYATARAKAAEAITLLLAWPDSESDADWIEFLDQAALAAWGAQDPRSAGAAWERLVAVRSRTLPADHSDLQRARLNLAVTIAAMGDLASARALEEQVLAVLTRTLPDSDPILQKARGNLAGTMYATGDLAGARALFEQVLENFMRTLPDDHADVQKARGSLAITIAALGDLAGARTLEEQVLEVFTRTLPNDHPDLQVARQHLAGTMNKLGDRAGARALFEQVLEVVTRTLPDDHPDVQKARGNLAITMTKLGDLAGARVLQEEVLEAFSNALPDDHPDLQIARAGLANTMRSLGDLAGARALQEKVLEIYARTLPDDHPDLQDARQNLAQTLFSLDDLAGARALIEQVFDVYSHTLPNDHPDLQRVRANFAVTVYSGGDFARARAIEEQVLAVRSRILFDDDFELRSTRANLAVTIAAIAFARRGTEELGNEKNDERLVFVDLVRSYTAGLARAARTALLTTTSREAEERCANLLPEVGLALSLVAGYGVFSPDAGVELQTFALGEATRGAALASTNLTRRARGDARWAALREHLRAASDEAARLAHSGGTRDEFDACLARRDVAERELVALSRERSDGIEELASFDPSALAATLSDDDALVAYRRYRRWKHVNGAATATPAESLCAYVLLSGPRLTRIELGGIEPIENAVRDWRSALGVANESRGVAIHASNSTPASITEPSDVLRTLIFDPLVPALTAAERIVVVLDDVLNLVPLDALLVDDHTLLGDRWHVETRATLTEMLLRHRTPVGSGVLLAVGDVSYRAEESVAATDVPARDTEAAGILRGSPWASGFSALPATGVEVRGVTASFRERFGDDAKLEVLEQAKATRESLITLAPQARWLHIATHGWFAPESIKSWNDPEPLDNRSGLALRMSAEERVRGMSPMLLCGLALTGANLSADATGRIPGLITAEEIATLDLTNCELAVLSACDTNVGERRAGQGVASLQKALQLAGARSVITSLWKVPDEATKELMLDFYRRLWVEKKPKWQALWEAKMKLRDVKDERGQPRYSTRDWAAWVLTGEPN